MTPEERFEFECYRATQHNISGAVSSINWKKIIKALNDYLYDGGSETLNGDPELEQGEVA